MLKKEEYHDYFEDEELEKWEEEIEELWEDYYGEFCEITNEEKAEEIRRIIRRRLYDDDS
jgi:hypothetical protein